MLKVWLESRWLPIVSLSLVGIWIIGSLLVEVVDIIGLVMDFVLWEGIPQLAFRGNMSQTSTDFTIRSNKTSIGIHSIHIQLIKLLSKGIKFCS